MGVMRVGDLVGGRYRLTAPLGRGAMGHVFRATDELLRRDVAVKTVDLTSATDATVAERFHREAIATAQLNHPNIVTIFDTGTDGRTAWLVMELIPGRPVSDLIREQGALSQTQAAQVGQKVAEALVATHAIGVVHRDIKPANIMVSGAQVTLLDFGIAQVSLDAEAHLTAPATTLGTAAYMSPEQAQGRRATAASDVYALGGVLVAMVTGQPPYPGDNAIQVAGRHISEPPVSVRARRPDVSAALDDLVLRMLAKDPGSRPTATIIAQALAHLAHNPSDAHTAVLPAAAAGVVAPAATAILPAGTAILPAATSELPRLPVPPAPPSAAQRLSTAPDAPRPGRAMNAKPFRTAGLWIGVLVAAILVFMVSWAVGSTVFRAASDPLASPGPASGAEPGTAPTSTAPKTAPTTKAPTTKQPPSGPSITLPTLPSAQDAALRAAIAGVDAALATLPTDTKDGERTASALKKSWAAASDDLLAGKKPQQALDKFRDQIDKQRDDGNLRLWEAEGIKLAVRAVQATLPTG